MLITHSDNQCPLNFFWATVALHGAQFIQRSYAVDYLHSTLGSLHSLNTVVSGIANPGALEHLLLLPDTGPYFETAGQEPHSNAHIPHLQPRIGHRSSQRHCHSPIRRAY